MDRYTEKERAFLIDLEAISRKHGIVVSGCGCCGSPNLEPMTDEDRAETAAGYGAGGSCDFSWTGPSDGPAWGNAKVRAAIVKGGA
jgi:hypothetical protein